MRGPQTRFPVKVERELREVLAGAGAVMRVALDAMAELVTVAVGAPVAVMTFPFARSHLRELARHHSGPFTPATRESWLAHLRAAWRDVDVAVAAVLKIQFEARQQGI